MLWGPWALQCLNCSSLKNHEPYEFFDEVSLTIIFTTLTLSEFEVIKKPSNRDVAHEEAADQSHTNMIINFVFDEHAVKMS